MNNLRGAVLARIHLFGSYDNIRTTQQGIEIHSANSDAWVYVAYTGQKDITVGNYDFMNFPHNIEEILSILEEFKS